MKFNKIFAMCLCFIAFGLVITMADLFSSLITVGGFSFAGENIVMPEYTFYAVCTDSYSEKLMASEFCETIKQQGGAGYLYMNKSSYLIIASIYETQADANKVLSNIKPTKPDSFVEEINICKININSTLNEQEKNTYSSCLSSFINNYKKLYDLSVSLDTQVINEVNARLEINKIASETQNLLTNYDIIFNNKNSTAIIKLKVGLNNQIECYSELSNTNSVYPFSAIIKETYCKIIIEYKKLAENF